VRTQVRPAMSRNLRLGLRLAALLLPGVGGRGGVEMGRPLGMWRGAGNSAVGGRGEEGEGDTEGGGEWEGEGEGWGKRVGMWRGAGNSTVGGEEKGGGGWGRDAGSGSGFLRKSHL
jgi:hypothetical protein